MTQVEVQMMSRLIEQNRELKILLQSSERHLAEIRSRLDIAIERRNRTKTKTINVGTIN